MIAEVTCAAASTDMKSASSVRTVCGPRGQLDRDVEREPEASLRTNEGAAQIVAIALTDPAAELDDIAARQEDGHRQHVIQSDAVFETVWASGILGDVAADGARRFAGWIRSVQQSVRRHVLVESEVHYARLDCGAAVLDVERDDLLESMESDDDDVVGERATRQTSAGSARNEGKSLVGEQSHDRDGLVPRSGENREPRLAPIPGKSVGVVDQQLARPAEHVPLTHDFGQTLRHGGFGRRSVSRVEAGVGWVIS